MLAQLHSKKFIYFYLKIAVRLIQNNGKHLAQSFILM